MAPPETVLSSGSVVFALPHIREAIFFYHAAELVKDRKAQLDAISRPVADAFWESFKELESDEKAEEWFARRLDALISGTNLLAVAKKLGLQLASYVEFLASRPLDVQFWLTACSVLGNSRKWEGQGRYHLRLEAHPRELKNGANVHEEPDSNPAQMLWHANGYDSGYKNHRYKEWADMEGLSHVLRDDIGRVFVMRLLDLRRQPFIFWAAASRPEIIFSEESPFLPIYEILEYNESQGLGAIIYQAPPCPLGPYLLPDCGRDELRRILERAHDCFSNLATLGKWGISLNKSFQHKWTYPITTQDEEPFLIPAYLQKTLDVGSPGKLRREGHYEERPPPAPRTAWPVSPLGGKGGIAGLPWSQITAYNDPRVPGPRIFFHNVVKANLSDADYEASAARSPYRWQRHLANDRYHDDLLIVARDLLDRFMGNIYGPRIIEVLRSSALSSAYEQCLLNGVDARPPGVEQGHSGLFRFCANCALGWGEKRNASHAYDINSGARCPTCCCSQMVTAVPDALRHLLHRIMEPQVREDGSTIVITAQEAHETMKSVMAREIPRLQSLYDDWVDKQPKVERMATMDPLPLDKIQRDVSGARWTMLEMLRGNHLDARFRRADHIKLRDAMRAFHAEKKKREEEREAKRRGIVAANAVDAPQRAGTASPAADEGSASISPRCAAVPDGVKRSAGGSEDEAKASKKAKAA